MASLFDSVFASSRVVLTQYHGEAVAVTEPGMDPATVTAILGAERTEERDGPHGMERVRVRSATFDPSVIVPVGGWTVTIAGEAWSVTAIESYTEAAIQVTLTRVEPLEITRHGYRRGPEG